MSRLTPLILLAVVAVLGTFAYLQTEREGRSLSDDGLTEPLFPGVDMGRISALRLEDIEGSLHLRFEKDRAGRWFITDPIAWPAEQNLVLEIEQVIERNRVVAVPAALAEQARSSFEPPEGFIEVEEALEGGEVRRTRVELGDVDLDGRRVYVRRDGRIYRTLRNFETPFTVGLNEYRSKRIFSIRPGEVVSIERVGGWYEDGDQQLLGMLAYREGRGWRIDSPARAVGDPALFTLWCRFLGRLDAKRFASDRPDVELSRFGLDAPWMSLSVTGASGVVQTVQFAAKDARVYCRRGEEDTVFEIDTDDLFRLREPVTSFLEPNFVRFEREGLTEVLLGRGERSVRLRAAGDGWTVAERREGSSDYSVEFAADRRRVEDLLTALEGAEVAQYFLDVEPGDFFPVGSRDRGIWVETRDGLIQGGAFGEAVRTPEGTELVPLLRDGDDIVGGVDPAFAALVGTPLVDLLDRDLWTLSNARLRGLRIRRDGLDRSFNRADEYDWQPADAKVPARELDPVLDHLLFLRAERHVPEGEREPLEDVVEVRFTSGDGAVHEARIGRVASGEAQVQLGALRAVLQRQELHADLVAIMDRKPDRERR